MPFFLRSKFLVLASLFLSSSLAQAEKFEVFLATGRQVVVERELSAQPSSDWVVLLPGSGCGLYDLPSSFWINSLRARRPLNVLVINKAGVDLKNHCDQSRANIGSLRYNRIADIGAALTEVIPSGSSILLIGESEGGYLVPDVALSHPEVTGAVMISGGTKSWIEEEIMMTEPGKREEVRRFLYQEVVGSEALDKFFRGWTYAQLNSFHTDRGYASLKALNIPLLAMHGADDKLVWVEGNAADFRKLASEGKSNIRHYIIAHGNHGLFDSRPHPEDLPAQDFACEKLMSFSERNLTLK